MIVVSQDTDGSRWKDARCLRTADAGVSGVLFDSGGGVGAIGVDTTAGGEETVCSAVGGKRSRCVVVL